MSVIRKLQEELDQVQTAQFVTTMLRDISATRLASIRAIYEANQAYYEQLHGLMEAVKRYAHKEGVDLEQYEPAAARVYVAVTANKRFYGSLNTDVMNVFAQRLGEHPDAAGYVIGQTGEQFVESDLSISGPIATTAFAADTATATEVRRVIEDLRSYRDVVVIHPTFINSFRQEVIETDITHQPVSDGPAPDAPSIDYLCEPELPQLLEFFRTHIRFTLFRRVLLETQVALTGARLMKMQRARERSVELVAEQQHTIHKEMSTIESMRLLETTVSFHKDSAI